MPMFAAGYCGFDFKNGKAQEFFAEWKESMLNGCFRGSWTDHRHDMTCASIIAHKHDMVKDYSNITIGKNTEDNERFSYISNSKLFARKN